jgi:hypothetical protein
MADSLVSCLQNYPGITGASLVGIPVAHNACSCEILTELNLQDKAP